MHIVETLLLDAAATRFSAASTEYPLDAMAETGLADRVSFYLNSNANQALTAQVVGHGTDSPRDLNGLLDVGGSVSLPATTGRIAMTVNLDDNWHPWYGITLTTGTTAPTSGRVRVVAVVRSLEPHQPETGQPDWVDRVLSTLKLQQLPNAEALQALVNGQQQLLEAIQQLVGQRPRPRR